MFGKNREKVNSEEFQTVASVSVWGKKLKMKVLFIKNCCSNQEQFRYRLQVDLDRGEQSLTQVGKI